LLKINSSLTTIGLYGNSYKNTEIYRQVEFLITCNVEWNPQSHSYLFEEFYSFFFEFLICLTIKQKQFNMKIPKFVLFEIIKRIDRKDLFSLYDEDVDENERKSIKEGPNSNQVVDNKEVVNTSKVNNDFQYINYLNNNPHMFDHKRNKKDCNLQ
jgi:hypothetical protein